MILVAYRHGLRASEVCDLQWQQIELSEGRLDVHRVKNGIPSVHPIRGDEMRALRKLRRDYPKEAYVFVSERGGRVSGRPPRCHSRSTRTCCAMPVGSNWPMMAMTPGPCSTTLATRTSSTPSGTPTWHPTGSRTFGGAELERPLHDAFVGLAGAGKPGTTSAPPQSLSPARAANIASIAAMASSICSSLIALTPPACSTFISLGIKSAQIFMYAAGCCLRTFSIAAAPCFLKSAASANEKSLLNDLRVASKEPPGFPRTCNVLIGSLPSDYRALTAPLSGTIE